MKKRVGALFVALVLFVMSLAGCGTESSSNASTGTDGSTAGTATGGDGGFNQTGYPIVDEPITLKVMFSVRDIDSLMPFEEMEPIKLLEEKTGIHAEWEVIKGNDWDTKLNLAFAGGEYPDVIISVNSTVDYEEYGVTQGILIPLDDLITQYMPNYTERAAMEEDDVLMGLVASDGNMYSVGYLAAQNQNTPGHYFINQAWLDALQLDMPTTVEELTDVFRAFKTQDPNGNGIADEIPYEICFDDVYGVTMVLPMFGIPAKVWSTKWLYVDDDMQVQFVGAADGFRDAMEWMNQLYTEELVDIEIISQDANMVVSKLSEGNVGFFSAWRIQAMGFGDWAEEDMVLMNPVAADGYKATLSKTLELAPSGRGAFITSTNQYPEATARWIDAMLETEMMFTLFNGMQDDGWYYNDEGLIVTKDLSESVVYDCLQSNAMFFAPGTYYYSVYENAPHRIEKAEYCEIYTAGGYIQQNSNDMLGLAPMSSEDASRSTLLFTDIDNSIKEFMAASIINGVTDESWEAFVSSFENLKLDEYMEIYQNALDNAGF